MKAAAAAVAGKIAAAMAAGPGKAGKENSAVLPLREARPAVNERRQGHEYQEGPHTGLPLSWGAVRRHWRPLPATGASGDDLSAKAYLDLLAGAAP